MDTPSDFLSEDLEPQIQSFVEAYMNPEYYDHEPQVQSLAATSLNPEYSDHLVAGPPSLAYQGFSSPPTRTRKKELFVEPISGENDPQSMHPLAEGSRKRKRSPSPSMDSPSNMMIDPPHESTETEMRAIGDSDTPSGPSQDRKGKGKATDLKGKGKQREVVPAHALPKPLSEPLSEHTCPICFSAPTNATLTPCGHICCGVCLFTAVKTVMQRAQTVGAPDANEARCPVCRAIIPDWDGYGGGVIGLKVRAIFSL